MLKEGYRVEDIDQARGQLKRPRRRWNLALTR